MINFKPNYNLCTDNRQEVYWDICKHQKTDTIMICTINNKPCPAWKGWKYEEEK
jgi:hypothetical protein